MPPEIPFFEENLYSCRFRRFSFEDTIRERPYGAKTHRISHQVRALLIYVCGLACLTVCSSYAAARPVAAVLPNGRLVTPVGTTEYIGPFPFTMALSPNGHQIVAPSIGWPFALNIIDDASSPHPHIHRIPKGNKSVPSVRVHTGVAYSPDGSLLYDATGDSGEVDVYRTSDWKRIDSISLDGDGYQQSFAASLAITLQTLTFLGKVL